MRTQKGQALLIAVLLMTVILLVGAIFVAITVYVQSQTARHGQMRQSKQMADAGVQYADRMLQLHTADWRPPEPPAWCPGPDGAFADLDAVLDGSADDVFDPGFWGRDAQRDTEDDYYTVEELERGWCALRLGPPLPDADGDFFPDRASADLSARDELVRRGFTRYPDPRRPTAAADVLPAAISNGHTLLRLTYDPDPPFEGTPDEDRNNDGLLNTLDSDPLSHLLQIEAIGAVLDETYTFQKLIACKPLALVDYARFVTDRSGTGQPAYFGIPAFIDFERDGNDASLPDTIFTRVTGPVRANTEMLLVGEPRFGAPIGSLEFRLLTDGTPNGALGPDNPNGYLSHDTVEATAGIRYRERLSDPTDPNTPGVQAQVTVVAPTGSNTQPIYPTDPQHALDGAFETYGDLTGDGTAALMDGQEDTDAAGYGRFCAAQGAPDLFRRDPASGRTAYEELTRYSGDPVQPPGAAYWANSGEWVHGDGIYVNNASDRQFVNARGECEIETLIDDWMRNLSPTDARGEDSGWNGCRTTYSPVGVEIWIVGEELPAGTYNPADARTLAQVRAIPDTQYWTPHHEPGEPQIVLRRSDQHWRTEFGDDSGRYTIVLDHPCTVRGTRPLNQVILAEGNVRVWGKLPDPGPVPVAAAPDTQAAVPYRNYGLAIISGGTLYIDGSILSPRDWSNPTDPNWASGAWDDRDTKLGLWARDCVCLNTTRIVPQDATALVTAAPDDADSPRVDAMHWELTPEAGARLFSSFQFGAPPAANVFLAARAAGDDPGPAALGMSFQRDWNASWVPYVFDAASPISNPQAFLFVAPGFPPGPQVSNAITPTFQPLPDADGAPPMPWLLDPATQISTAPGARNNLQMYWANPGLGAGATSPWVSKLKIVESNSADPTDLTAVLPAVHCRVNASIYAQGGCWFVIPGPYFESIESIDAAIGGGGAENLNGRIDTPDEIARAATYLRYNYDIVVRGSITENFTAPVEAVQEWTDKWACNVAASTVDPSMPATRLSVRYQYDRSMREARDRGDPAALSGSLAAPLLRRSTEAANLARVPCQPVSSDLVYYGETM